MRILIAPTAFKGSFSPAQVSLAMLDGIGRFSKTKGKLIETDILPLADGGDGTIEALHMACGGKLHKLMVRGAQNEAREALWLEFEDTAIIEMASACGIAGLRKEHLAPLAAHSRGLGQVLKHVLNESKLKNIVIAVGGSASTDGGSGALYELGAKFFDTHGKEFIPAGGASLLQLRTCDLSAAATICLGRKISVATDVHNPLLGENGAAAVFGPQKGAGPEEIRLLESGLSTFAEILEKATGVYCRDIAGAGAAGGSAFGFRSGLGAEIISGFEFIADLTQLEAKVKKADLILSGEGRIDKSSRRGKVAGSLMELCRKHGKQLCLFAGSVASEIQLSSTADVQFFGLANDRSDKFADTETIASSIQKFLSSL